MICLQMASLKAYPPPNSSGFATNYLVPNIHFHPFHNINCIYSTHHVHAHGIILLSFHLYCSFICIRSQYSLPAHVSVSLLIIRSPVTGPHAHATDYTPANTIFMPIFHSPFIRTCISTIAIFDPTIRSHNLKL